MVVHQGVLAKGVRVNSRVKGLLQQILEHIDEELEPGYALQIDGHIGELVLEAQVMGAHYALLRFTPRSQFSQPQISLSPREQEIVRLVIKGLPNKMIAKVLDISPWTVATHLRRVYVKLDVNSRAEMVACVLKQDLLGSGETQLVDETSLQLLHDEGMVRE